MIAINIKTEYSLLQSLIKLDDLIEYFNSHDINTSGICDCNAFSLLPYYIICKKNNIKPVLGLEVFVEDKKVLVYAKSEKGYYYLLKINTLYQKNELKVKDLENDNILVVVPFENKDLKIKEAFLGYSNKNEKVECLLESEKIVYIKEVRTLKKEDIKYLKYLKELGKDFSYDEDSFMLDIDNDDEKRLNEFCSLIDINLDFNKKYLPKYKEGIDSYKFLSNLAMSGLKKRLNNEVSDIYLNRLNEELDIINKMGFVDYFLIVYDYVLYAKKHDCMIGPGRGSAAGSLVSFSIGITDIDPIKYDLLFSRFLNPSRGKMPDIDIDFEDSKRDEIINYVREKYGYDKVALGLTFNTYKAKLILRDLAKVLKIDDSLIEKFIKYIDASKTLKENLENNDIKKFLIMYKELKELFDISLKLENLKKNVSTHAAAVIISPKPLDEIIPIYLDGDIIKTGYVMDYMEMLGLLKMDFLGLKNLSIISSLKKKTNIDLLNIDLNDKKTYELLSNGDTSDIFQFESSYTKKCLLKLKPKSFMELVNAIALVRPGASGEIDEYIKSSYDKNLDDILHSTRGVIIYQEQVMQIFEKIGGYSLYEADDIRRSMSKKDSDALKAHHNNFVERGVKNGYEKNYLENLFLKLAKFAGYGFNKSHAVSYAYISYIEAYFKANYNNLFNMMLLQGEKNTEKIKDILISLKKNNVKILKPNINFSKDEFIEKNNSLLIPLTFIKTINKTFTDKIISNRPYETIYDLFLKCNDFLNEKNYNALVFSDALNLFKINHHTLIENYKILKNWAEIGSDNKPILKEMDEYDLSYLQEKEKEYFDMYISNHPASKYKNPKINEFEKYLFKNIKGTFLIEKITKIKTKKNDDMAFIILSDETGQIEVVAFKEVIKYLDNVSTGNLVTVSLSVSKRFDKLSIILNNIERK